MSSAENGQPNSVCGRLLVRIRLQSCEQFSQSKHIKSLPQSGMGTQSYTPATFLWFRFYFLSWNGFLYSYVRSNMKCIVLGVQLMRGSAIFREGLHSWQWQTTQVQGVDIWPLPTPSNCHLVTGWCMREAVLSQKRQYLLTLQVSRYCLSGFAEQSLRSVLAGSLGDSGNHVRFFMLCKAKRQYMLACK